MVSEAQHPAQRWDVSTEVGVLACYDTTMGELYPYAFHLTGDAASAEDLTQEAYLRLVRAARDGQVAEIGIGWLMTTLQRLFVDRLRRAGRERVRLELVASMPEPAVSALAGEVDERATAGELLSALHANERAALVFRYVDDLPVREVAELLGLSLRATESLLQRAKQRAKRGVQDER